MEFEVDHHYASDLLALCNRELPTSVSMFSRASHTVAPVQPVRFSARMHCSASTAQL